MGFFLFSSSPRMDNPFHAKSMVSRLFTRPNRSTPPRPQFGRLSPVCYPVEGLRPVPAVTLGTPNLYVTLRSEWKSHVPVVRPNVSPGVETHLTGRGWRYVDYTRRLRYLPETKVLLFRHFSSRSVVPTFLRLPRARPGNTARGGLTVCEG